MWEHQEIWKLLQAQFDLLVRNCRVVKFNRTKYPGCQPTLKGQHWMKALLNTGQRSTTSSCRQIGFKNWWVRNHSQIVVDSWPPTLDIFALTFLYWHISPNMKLPMSEVGDNVWRYDFVGRDFAQEVCESKIDDWYDLFLLELIQSKNTPTWFVWWILHYSHTNQIQEDRNHWRIPDWSNTEMLADISCRTIWFISRSGPDAMSLVPGLASVMWYGLYINWP